MKNVIATAPGFHGGCRIRTGETFSVPDDEKGGWFVDAAPGKTPAPVLDRWNVEIVKVLNDEGVKKALLAHGLTPQPTTRPEFAAFMKKEYDQWGKVVKERKITSN